MRLLLLALLLAQAPRGMAEYQRARAIAEPRARIVALERFLAEFGNGGGANRAREDVLRAMVEAGEPDEAIGGFVRRSLAEATPFQKTELPQRFADALLELRRALPVAAAISADGATARLRATHGRVLIATGDREGARRELAGVVETNPELTAAVRALASIEADAGRRRELEALAYLTEPAGPAPAAALLDRVYAERFARAVPVVRRPEAAAGRRRALVEFFTSASCLPCQGAELAFDALRERFPQSELVTIAHHVNVPGPDPLTHSGAEDWQQRRGAEGVPTFYVDGELVSEGGTRAAAQRIFDELEKAVLAKLDGRASSLRLNLTRRGGRLEANVAAAPGVAVRLALIEQRVTHSGPNAIRFHSAVVREFVPEARPRHVFAAEPGRAWSVAAYTDASSARDAQVVKETP